MEARIEKLKRAWNDRQRRLGATKRAVLFKRFPNLLNESIHHRHMVFVLQNIPDAAASLLDVGCGYGRISMEIKRQFPTIVFQGVDLCEKFATAYTKDIGPCFNGPIQDFAVDRQFDVIISITCLMYLDAVEHRLILERLWSMLNSGGCLICIEPAIEILQLWRRLTRRENASPTGDSVYHFRRSELNSLCSGLNGAIPQATASLNLVPFLSGTALHHCIAVAKG